MPFITLAVPASFILNDRALKKADADKEKRARYIEEQKNKRAGRKS